VQEGLAERRDYVLGLNFALTTIETNSLNFVFDLFQLLFWKYYSNLLMTNQALSRVAIALNLNFSRCPLAAVGCSFGYLSTSVSYSGLSPPTVSSLWCCKLAASSAHALTLSSQAYRLRLYASAWGRSVAGKYLESSTLNVHLGLPSIYCQWSPSNF